MLSSNAACWISAPSEVNFLSTSDFADHHGISRNVNAVSSSDVCSTEGSESEEAKTNDTCELERV